MWSKEDLKELEKRNISISEIEKQIEIFKRGFKHTTLVRPATINDGIIKFNSFEENKYLKKYEESIKNKSVIKFVPASGAATRMFKEFYEFINSDSSNIEEFKNLKNFFANIEKLPFYEMLLNIVDIKQEIEKNNYKKILQKILSPEGLNYGNLPKALIPVHKYQNEIRTPFEEHLVEGVLYSKINNKVKIHFTVQEEHLHDFKKIEEEKLKKYEEKYNVLFEIEYSTQMPCTDTIAVDINNQPLRENNKLVFRPGGHGALLKNLNNINEDIIFIKNIDNVCPDKLKQDTEKYKKILCGFLLEIIEKIFEFQKKFDNGIIEMEGIISFFKNYFHLEVRPKTNEEVKELLFRPVRVCGMVKNVGQPGGGPFWALDSKKNISLQIVEMSQINTNDPKQKEILVNSTHFNPVDIVCCIKNYKGEKYDLSKFVDYETYFITEKTKDGIPLKALELPGLWNGSMAFWNTIFIDVPITTFNPIKTIFDILKENHLQ